MTFYAYQAINLHEYNSIIEKAISAIIAATILVSVVLLIIETLGAWRM